MELALIIVCFLLVAFVSISIHYYLAKEYCWKVAQERLEDWGKTIERLKQVIAENKILATEAEKSEHYRARLSRYEDPDNDPLNPDTDETSD